MALGLAACSIGQGPGSDARTLHETVGSLDLGLQLGPDFSLDDVAYVITGPAGFSSAGNIDVSRSTTLSAQISALPIGQGYSITLSASANRSTATCSGVAGFDVAAGQASPVTVRLSCHEAPHTGSVLVVGQINVCPVLDGLNASPSEAAVGGTIALLAEAHDIDAGPAALTYHWTSSGGTLSSDAVANPTLTCTGEGVVSLRLSVGDGDPAPSCADNGTLTVTCSPAPLGKTCLQCASAAPSSGEIGQACPALAACDASPACSKWADCLRACNDDACARQCDDEDRNVSRLRYDVYACLCKSCDATCTPIVACSRRCDGSGDLEMQATAPATLADTHLYSSGTTIAPYAHAFQPRFPLWSDGDLKDRHIYLPACAKIDDGDMDHWNFPVGTRLWKEFKVMSNGASDPNSAVPVETRLIHRFGPGPNDWIFAAYQWAQAPGGGVVPDPAQARLVENGLINANGTAHDIPSTSQCRNCHTKLSERVLGFGAIELSHGLGGLTMTDLSDNGWLTVPARDGFQPPGEGVAQAALGYLHANCGHCHNSNFRPAQPPPLMRLLVSFKDVTDTDTYKSLVNVPTQNPDFSELFRIRPGYADQSEIIVRMGRRPPQTGQMPPLATKVANTAAIEVISSWINLLPSL